MKRIIAVLMVSVFVFSACAQSSVMNETSEGVPTNIETVAVSSTTQNVVLDTIPEAIPETLVALENCIDTDSYLSLNDQELLQYVSDNVFSNLENDFANDDYIVENVSTRYVSKEYIDELTYNSLENVYFGYTLNEIQEVFGEQPYIFTLGDDGTTEIRIIEPRDTIFNEIIKNIAIGSGVIFLCVTVSAVTTGPVSLVFALSALSASDMAVQSALISGIIKAIVTGIQTGDFEEVEKQALLAASKGFAFGALFGALTEGISDAIFYDEWFNVPNWLYDSEWESVARPDWLQSESDALEMLYPGGVAQVSYLDGLEVPYNTLNATRPDIVWNDVAVEVKNYDLVHNLGNLTNELKREISDRVANLPSGMSQAVVLDARGQGLEADTLADIVTSLKAELWTIYQDIPIQVIQ